MGSLDVSRMRRARARRTTRGDASAVAGLRLRRCTWRAFSPRILVALVVSSVIPTAAVAQQASADDPFAGVEEMIVTGSGTAALLAPSSTSAIAFDSATLEATGVENIGDIAAQVPNLEIRSQNATNASFFVRGVGLQDFGANASSSVPIFQDGIARNPSATQLVGLYDISGLSVLKGPQGVGNYRNASAGAFLVQTTQPEPEFSGFAKTTLARLVSVDSRDANRYGFEMAMGAPVYGDIVSLRVAARYDHENPFFENGCANRSPIEDRPRLDDSPGGLDAIAICHETFQRQGTTDRTGKSHVTPFLSKYLGEVDDFGFRGSIRIQPPDTNIDTVLRVELSRLNRDSTLGQHIGISQGQIGRRDSGNYADPDVQEQVDALIDELRAANPGLRRREARDLALVQVGKELYKRPLDKEPYRGDFDRPGRTILDTHALSLATRVDLEDFDIDLNLGFLDYRKSEARDTDLSPNVRFPSRGNDQAYELYGSLKLSGEQVGDVPLAWDTGFYTMHEQVEANLEQQVFDAVRTNQFTQEIYSFGVYANAKYEFLEGFELEAGVRYNWERKDFEVGEVRDTTSTGGIVITQGSENQRTWDAVTGHGLIRYHFTEDVSTYVKYTRGFKAGHFNPSRPQAAKDPEIGFADPEQIDAVEWNVRFSTWSSRITGNTGFFFYNYKNYQVFRLTTDATGVFRSIQSARQARNYGAEMELTMTPLEGIAPEMIEGLRINLRFGWLETNYVEFTVFESREFEAGRIGVPIDYSGNPLINAANLQASGTFAWPIVFNRLGTFTPQYDFTWTDDTPFDPNNGRGELDAFGQDRLPNYIIGNRAYILHNVRLQWEPPGEPGLVLAGWCRNLTDERYKDFSVDISTFSGQTLEFVADPRMCGADIRFNF